MTEKIVLKRWQWEDISDVLIGCVPSRIQDWMDEHFKIRTVPTSEHGVSRFETPDHYIFFGYKQEMTKWRLANGISPKYTTLARDWEKLRGLRVRPVPVYDWGWMYNNIRHEIVRNARREIEVLETTYGSGSELYRSYDD